MFSGRVSNWCAEDQIMGQYDSRWNSHINLMRCLPEIVKELPKSNQNLVLGKKLKSISTTRRANYETKN